MRNLSYFAFNCIFPLLAGAFLYLLRGDGRLPLLKFINREKGLLSNTTRSHLPDFVFFQIPDALWAYAFCAVLLYIWRKADAAFTTLAAFCFCAAYEGMQLIKMTAGTFDLWDIAAMGLACATAYLLIGNYFK